MGATSSCCNHTPAEEIIIESDTKVVNPIIDKQIQDTFEDDCCVTIQFIPLSESNPELSLAVSFQSLARGFLHRSHFSFTASKLQLSLSLQTLSKSFLAKHFLNSSLKKKYFGIYNYLEGSIQDLITLDLTSIHSFETGQIASVLNSSPLIETTRNSAYQGEWDKESHLPHGFGIQTYRDGSTYAGYFDQGQRDGNGYLHFSDESVYEGEFKANQMHGEGQLRFVEGRTVSGKFVEGYLEGTGKEVWDNGTLFEGTFVKSKKQGKGLLTVPKHSVYEGEFYRDRFHGKGKLTLENQTSYEGDWDRGRMHGKGTFLWPNGKVYVGEYVYDKKHGNGRMKYPNKSVYNGEWRNDLQHGKAVYTFFNKKAGKMKSYNSYWENGNKITYLKKDGTFFEASDSEVDS